MDLEAGWLCIIGCIFLARKRCGKAIRQSIAEDIVKEIMTEANEYLSLLSKKMEKH